METTWMSINWYMEKWNVVSPYSGTLFNHKKECHYMDEPYKHYAKWKKPVAIDHVFCDSIYVKCPESIKAESKVGVASCWGSGEWGRTANGPEVSFWGDAHVLELDSGSS